MKKKLLTAGMMGVLMMFVMTAMPAHAQDASGPAPEAAPAPIHKHKGHIKKSKKIKHSKHPRHKATSELQKPAGD